MKFEVNDLFVPTEVKIQSFFLVTFFACQNRLQTFLAHDILKEIPKDKELLLQSLCCLLSDGFATFGDDGTIMARKMSSVWFYIRVVLLFVVAALECDCNKVSCFSSQTVFVCIVCNGFSLCVVLSFLAFCFCLFISFLPHYNFKTSNCSFKSILHVHA